MQACLTPVRNLLLAINYPMIATHRDNFCPPSKNVNFRNALRDCFNLLFSKNKVFNQPAHDLYA